MLTREKVRGATVHKAGSKIPTWLTVSAVYKPETPAAKSLYRSNINIYYPPRLELPNYN
jgi:hypothetical protein